LTAVARDAAGNTTTSAAVTVTVDNLNHAQCPFGYTISLYSGTAAKYVRADSADGFSLKADATSVSAATKFLVVNNGDGSFSLQHAANGNKYAFPDPTTFVLKATGVSIGTEDKYTWIANGDGTISFTSNLYSNHYVFPLSTNAWRVQATGASQGP